MSIENTATDHTTNDRAFREAWIRAILAQPNTALTPGQKVTAVAMAWHMNMDPTNKWHRATWIKAENIAKETSQSVSATTDHLRDVLWKQGWLKRIGRTDNGRGSWVYKFVIPDHASQRTTPASGVRQPAQSDHSRGGSQTTATETVRPLPPAESDHSRGRTEYMNHSVNDPVNESMNHPINGDEDEIEEIKDKKPVDIKAATQEFKDAYPMKAAVHLIEKPFKEAMDQGATADQLILAAKNYADECQRTNKEMGFIKFPTKFLNEGIWENYLTTPRTRTSAPSLDEILSWGVSSEYDYSHMPEDERPF